MSFELLSESKNNVLILSMSGRLDSINSTHAEANLLDQIENSTTAVILDLEMLDYVASAGLRIVLMAAKRAKAQNKPFLLCALQPQIHHVFEISGFLKILSVYSSQTEAIAALNH